MQRRLKAREILTLCFHIGFLDAMEASDYKDNEIIYFHHILYLPNYYKKILNEYNGFVNRGVTRELRMYGVQIQFYEPSEIKPWNLKEI